MHRFEPGTILFNPNMRHSALLQRGNTLWVFWTQVGEAPERILLSRINLARGLAWLERSWYADRAAATGT